MRIETDRLILRPPALADCDDIASGINDLAVSGMLMVVPYPYGKSDAVEFMERVTKHWNEKPQTDYTFYLELKESGKVIGATGLHKVNQFDGTTTTGSWIRQDHWRRGFILEAKIPVLDFAFDVLQLRRIETSAFIENTASQAMSEKLGFVSEGVSRAATRSVADGVIHDEVQYGLFYNEWQEAKARIIGK